MRCLLFLALIILLPQVCKADTCCDGTDSIRVEALLRQGREFPADSSLMLFYARQFLDVPYVAHTLESPDGQERLVVNLRQMDCTTLVETVTALTLATRNGGTSWGDYCHWLMSVRYLDGKKDGYASRCHYFSQWVASAEARGLVSEVRGDDVKEHSPFTGTQHLRLHYMSRHRASYPAIAQDEAEAKRVACYEREYSGARVHYIPARLTGKSREELSCIQDGDILALVTKKDGLDVSHLGLAVWGPDGLLHLLNASSLYHRVVLDSVPLHDYLLKHPSTVGVRVVRVN